VAMAAFQASIGAVNDLRDAPDDAVGQPWKPIPSGRVGPRTARRIAAVAGGIGILCSAAFGLGALIVGIAGYALGLAYDLRLKRTAWGWLCFAIALPLVPLFAWLAVGAGLPPAYGMLFVLGLLAGGELAIANALADDAADRQSGTRSIAVRLGTGRARAVMSAAAVGVLVVAWVSLPGAMDADPSAAAGAATAPLILVLAAGSLALVAGVGMALRRDGPWAWRGWQAQAIGVALMAIAWLAAVA
jgi:4-hydroxybenzoate polyprenyltransferase